MLVTAVLRVELSMFILEKAAEDKYREALKSMAFKDVASTKSEVRSICGAHAWNGTAGLYEKMEGYDIAACFEITNSILYNACGSPRGKRSRKDPCL